MQFGICYYIFKWFKRLWYQQILGGDSSMPSLITRSTRWSSVRKLIILVWIYSQTLLQQNSGQELEWRNETQWIVQFGEFGENISSGWPDPVYLEHFLQFLR